MVRIGVCDDLAEELHRQKQMLFRVIKEFGWNAEVMCFQSGEELLCGIDNLGSFDIIFMDVEMTGMNGVETARKIREMDSQVILIFVSLHDQYCKEMIRVQPFSFIDKPVEEAELRKVVADAVKIQNDYAQIFRFTHKKVVYKLLLKKIRYFESDKREIHIFYGEEKYSFYKKLDDVEKEIMNSAVKFIRVGKSFLVNASFIKEFWYDKVILDDDSEIGISSKYRAAVKDYYVSMMKTN